MKRTALLLLTAIYLVSCLGMSVDRSYCCGKLASVKLSYGATDNNKKAAAKKNNCCRNEKQGFKVKDNHISITPFSLSHPTVAFIPSLIIADNKNIDGLYHTKTIYKANAPPGRPFIPVYTLNCTYRI